MWQSDIVSIIQMPPVSAFPRNTIENRWVWPAEKFRLYSSHSIPPPLEKYVRKWGRKWRLSDDESAER
jgi:hypothetical protein